MNFKLLDKSYALQLAELDNYFAADAWSAESFASELESPLSKILGVEQEGQVQAYLVVKIVMDEAELLRIHVKPEKQRMGLGQSLITAICHDLVGLGVKILHLEVRESNEVARRFYDSQGFVNSGRRKNYYKNPLEDAILMRRMLIK